MNFQKLREKWTKISPYLSNFIILVISYLHYWFTGIFRKKVYKKFLQNYFDKNISKTYTAQVNGNLYRLRDAFPDFQHLLDLESQREMVLFSESAMYYSYFRKKAKKSKFSYDASTIRESKIFDLFSLMKKNGSSWDFIRIEKW